MDALRQAYGFLRRNRRAIGLIVGASAAGVAIWRVKRVLDEYKRLIKEHDVARLDQHRLQMHMLRSRGECVPALLNFMQTLRKRVNEIVDVTSPVKALKSRRNELSKEEEQQLWQQVKVSGFTRFFLAYYGFNLLNVMLRVQVHILGRYAFENSKKEMEALQEQFKASQQQQQGQKGGESFVGFEQQPSGASSSSSFSTDDRYRLLSLVYEFFLGEGLRQLKEVVERVVAEELAPWSVHEKVHVGYTELHDVLSRIRRRLEGPRGITTAELPLLKYIIDLDAKTEEELGGRGSTLSEMVNETWDALESPSFKLAVEDCLDSTFRVFLEDLYLALYAGLPTPSSSSHPPPPPPHQKEERGVVVEEGEGREGEEATTKHTQVPPPTQPSPPQETGQDSGPEDPEMAAGAAAAAAAAGVGAGAGHSHHHHHHHHSHAQEHEHDPPLAKLIPHMKNAATKVFNNDPQSNDYIRVTADNRSVNLLCSSFFTSEITFL